MTRYRPLTGLLLPLGLALPLHLAPAAPLAIDARRIDAAFAACGRADSPGCAVGVQVRGEVAFTKGYGLASLEHGVPITRETVFDLGSTSKQFTAAAIGLLALDGRLSLDDDVRKTVPEIPDYGTVITLRHLLTHTSGLRDYTDLLFLAGKREEDVTTTSDALAILSRQRALNFRPGTEYRYCNSGFFLASVIVERVSGRTLREFARERLFRPVGMTRTDFLDDHTQVVPGRATGYAPRDGGGFKVAMSNWEQAGDGSVQSSVADLFRWSENFETGKVGGRNLFDLLESPGRLLDGTPLGYGLGLSLGEHRAQRMISHGGAWAGYRAMLMRFPAQRLAVATLCNISTADTTALSLAAADAALDALGVPGAPPPSGRDPSTTGTGAPVPATAAGASAPAGTPGLAGVYVNEHLGEVLRLTISENGWRLTGLGSPSDLVPEEGVGAPEPAGNVLLQSVDGRLRVRIERDGSELTLHAASLGPRPLSFARKEASEELERQFPARDAAGKYGAPELGPPLIIALNEGALTLRLPSGEESELRRIAPDLCESDFGLVRFGRDARGRVSSLILTNRGLAGLVVHRLAPPSIRKPEQSVPRESRPEPPESGGV